MEMKIGKKYKLKFIVGEKREVVYFTGLITSLENSQIEFIDIFGMKLKFPRAELISILEVSN